MDTHRRNPVPSQAFFAGFDEMDDQLDEGFGDFNNGDRTHGLMDIESKIDEVTEPPETMAWGFELPNRGRTFQEQRETPIDRNRNIYTAPDRYAPVSYSSMDIEKPELQNLQVRKMDEEVIPRNHDPVRNHMDTELDLIDMEMEREAAQENHPAHDKMLEESYSSVVTDFLKGAAENVKPAEGYYPASYNEPPTELPTNISPFDSHRYDPHPRSVPLIKLQPVPQDQERSSVFIDPSAPKVTRGSATIIDIPTKPPIPQLPAYVSPFPKESIEREQNINSPAAQFAQTSATATLSKLKPTHSYPMSLEQSGHHSVVPPVLVTPIALTKNPSAMSGSGSILAAPSPISYSDKPEKLVTDQSANTMILEKIETGEREECLQPPGPQQESSTNPQKESYAVSFCNNTLHPKESTAAARPLPTVNLPSPNTSNPIGRFSLQMPSLSPKPLTSLKFQTNLPGIGPNILNRNSNSTLGQPTAGNLISDPPFLTDPKTGILPAMSSKMVKLNSLPQPSHKFPHISFKCPDLALTKTVLCAQKFTGQTGGPQENLDLGIKQTGSVGNIEGSNDNEEISLAKNTASSNSPFLLKPLNTAAKTTFLDQNGTPSSGLGGMEDRKSYPGIGITFLTPLPMTNPTTSTPAQAFKPSILPLIGSSMSFQKPAQLQKAQQATEPQLSNQNKPLGHQLPTPNFPSLLSIQKQTPAFTSNLQGTIQESSSVQHAGLNYSVGSRPLPPPFTKAHNLATPSSISVQELSGGHPGPSNLTPDSFSSPFNQHSFSPPTMNPQSRTLFNNSHAESREMLSNMHSLLDKCGTLKTDQLKLSFLASKINTIKTYLKARMKDTDRELVALNDDLIRQEPTSRKEKSMQPLMLPMSPPQSQQFDAWNNLNQIDLSGVGMSSTNSPIATRTDILRGSPTRRDVVKIAPAKKKERSPLDDLNNWDYCNPDRVKDVLPQPFRFIDEILEDVLMRKVNQKIDQIDQLKSNPSYEGHINKVQPSGAYEIDGITCFSQEENSLGYVLAGDVNGCVYLLDIANKARLTKFDTKEKKSILEIIMQTVKYGDRLAIIFFVVYIGKYEVDCFLMFSHELINVRKVFSFGKEFKPHVENLDQKKPGAPPTPILGPGKKPAQAAADQKKQEDVAAAPKVDYLDHYPMKVYVAPTLDFLCVVNFQGDYKIFEIPYLPIIKNHLGLDDRVDHLLHPPGQGIEFDRGELNKLPPFNDFIRKRSVESIEQIQVLVVPDGVAEGEAHKRLKEKTADEMLAGLKDMIQKKRKEVVEAIAGAAGQGKDKKPGMPSAANPQAVGQGAKKIHGKPDHAEPEEAKPKLEFFENEKIPLVDGMKSIPFMPEFYPQVYFRTGHETIEHDEYVDLLKMAKHELNQDELAVANGTQPQVVEKLLRSLKKNSFTASILIVWRGTNHFQESILQAVKNRLPQVKYNKDFLHFYSRIEEYLGLTFNKSPLKYSKSSTMELGSHITACSVSSSQKYLGLGLDNGTTTIWDLELQSFGQTLDKHSKAVTCMGFYQDWILVTGSKDGTVQMYDLSVDGAGDRSTFMAQKNFFTIVNKEKYIEDQNEIVDLIVSPSGLVFVLDKFKNGRTYSVFHGQKIFKATPGLYFSLETLTGAKPTKSEFQVRPTPVMTVAHSRHHITRYSLRKINQGGVRR